MLQSRSEKSKRNSQADQNFQEKEMPQRSRGRGQREGQGRGQSRVDFEQKSTADEKRHLIKYRIKKGANSSTQLTENQ